MNIEEINDEYEAYDRDHPEYTKEDIMRYLLDEVVYSKENPNSNYDYSENKKIIEEILVLENIYNYYLKKLVEILDDDNFDEVARLTDFLIFYHQQELLCLEKKLDPLDEAYIEVYNDNDNLNNKQVDLNIFMETELNKLRNKKAVEKKLKI